MSHALKLQRAKEQMGSLQAAIERWFKEDSHRVDANFDPRTGQHVARLYLLKPLPADEWSLLIGDCLFNLRSCLDHLAFELARKHQPPTTDDEAMRIEFPIFGDRAPTAGELNRRIGRIHPDAQTIIQGLQPYLRGAAFERDELWMLRRLNNIDKHRSLHVTLLRRDVAAIILRHGALTNTVSTVGPLEDGAELIRYQTVPIRPNEEVDVEFAFALDVAFEDRPPAFGNFVVPLLSKIHDYISASVIAPLTKYL